MKAIGLWVWNAIKVIWWVIVLVISTVFLVGFIKRNKREQSDIDESASEESVSYANIAKEKVDVALTNVKIEQAIIKEKAASKRAELEEIRNEPEGIRRDKLASILRTRI